MTQTNIGTNELIIGIDVAKDKLDIIILPEKEYHVVENTQKAINLFISKILSKAKVRMIVMESTGGYERLAFELFFAKQLPVHIAHPNKVFHYGKAKGFFAKTDKIDAYMLANYALDNNLSECKFDQARYELRELSCRINQLKSDLMSTRCRIASPNLSAITKKSLTRQEKWLVQELNSIEKQLDKQIAKDTELTQTHRIIASVKGVGKATANLLITQVDELGALTKGEIAALCGLAPRNNDSGKRRGTRRVVGGKSTVRKALFLCALSAVKHNNKLKLFYSKLIEAGKKPKVALIAVARKLIVIINHLVAKQIEWDENYEKNAIIV